jgi:hypothetical protein
MTRAVPNPNGPAARDRERLRKLESAFEQLADNAADPETRRIAAATIQRKPDGSGLDMETIKGFSREEMDERREEVQAFLASRGGSVGPVDVNDVETLADLRELSRDEMLALGSERALEIMAKGRRS